MSQSASDMETSDGPAASDAGEIPSSDGSGSGTNLLAKAGSRTRRARQALIERFDAYEQRWPPLALSRSFVGRYFDVNGVVLAGHLAFRSFTFLLPLAFVMIAAAGLVTYFGHDPGAAAGDELKLGQALVSTIRQAGSEASEAPFHVAGVALVGLVLGALGMLSGLNYVYAMAWRIRERKVIGKWHKLWRLVLALALLFMVMAVASATRKSGFVLGLGVTLGVGVAYFFGMLGLALIMPRRADGWRWLIPGAVVGTLALLGLHVFANLYLPDKLASLSATYGSLAIAVVLLSYLYLFGQVIVLSAIANAVWFDSFSDDVDEDL